jgi:ankyrin repeat protein
MLLERQDIDVNAKNAQGHTPLHYATIPRRIAIAKILLARQDIDVNVKNGQGQC